MSKRRKRVQKALRELVSAIDGTTAGDADLPMVLVLSVSDNGVTLFEPSGRANDRDLDAAVSVLSILCRGRRGSALH